MSPPMLTPAHVLSARRGEALHGLHLVRRWALAELEQPELDVTTAKLDEIESTLRARFE